MNYFLDLDVSDKYIFNTGKGGNDFKKGFYNIKYYICGCIAKSFLKIIMIGSSTKYH